MFIKVKLEKCMASRLLSFNISGILFVSHRFAEASAIAIDDVEERYQHRTEIQLDPPMKAISRWTDDRVIATFQSLIRPGRLISITISYTGGFYDKKKDPWPDVWGDERIKKLISDVIEQVAIKAGFRFDDPVGMFDLSTD